MKSLLAPSLARKRSLLRLPATLLLAAHLAATSGFGAPNPHDQSSSQSHPAAPDVSQFEGKPAPTAQQLKEAFAAADALLARQDLVAYRGLIKYLKFRADADPARFGVDSLAAKMAYANLVDWTTKIAADPDLVHKLRGVYEWAYESEADGSGQPFHLSIPTDYDPAKPAGISLYCHGYSGNHMEHSVGMAPHPGRFDIAVLGRARGGQYRGLSERDVLDVLAYVKATWHVDENRVDLSGGSMGGFASLWFGSRYPDLFACTRPSCGYALQTPVENLVNLPVYSLHSADDPIVNAITSRGPLQQVRDLGGLTIIEETNGYGHAVWGWGEGQARAAVWGEKQVRPSPENVREIRYTAIDGAATGAWWAHVAEWGPRQAQAVFHLRLGPANVLYGSVKNITRLRLDLAHSPVDRTQPLLCSLDASKPLTLAAPLPERVDLVVTEKGAAFEPCAAPSVRPHTPGAAGSVYDGSPLLIVYGTKGDAATNAALRAAATAAAKSPNTSWPEDKIENAPTDGVSHFQNLYGDLPVKADTEVSETDLATHHLVLLGSARQNALVARLAKQLPVSDDGASLVTSDGFSYPKNNHAWALTHFNPLAPQRLVLWLASETTDFYKAGALLPRELMVHGGGADFVVLSPEGRIFAARSFDTSWSWSPAYRKSPLLPPTAATKSGWAALQAEAFRKASGADFGLAVIGNKDNWPYRQSFQGAEGVTRFSDMALLNYQMRLFLVELTGAELSTVRSRLKDRGDGPLAFSSNFDHATLEAASRYTVTIDSETLAPLVETLGTLIQSVRATGIQEVDAIEDFGERTGR